MKSVLLIILAIGLVTQSTHAAAVDFFLKIEGIDGESTDDRHANEIEIISFSWGVTQAGSAASGGGAGKVAMRDISFSTRASKASPKLFLACATGQHLASVKFVVHRPDGSAKEYVRIEMQDVYITSYQTGGSGDSSITGESRPMESLSMNYTKIVYTYTALDGSETSGEAVFPTITQ
jgi:type VI secretion system secreted protein Hcp